MALSQTSEPEKTQGTDATNKQKRMKWTEEMNNVLLECKQTAISLITSDNPPRTENGRKKGYMKIMKDLWEETEYRHLELTSQNLRDQAARVETTLGNVQ